MNHEYTRKEWEVGGGMVEESFENGCCFWNVGVLIFSIPGSVCGNISGCVLHLSVQQCHFCDKFCIPVLLLLTQSRHVSSGCGQPGAEVELASFPVSPLQFYIACKQRKNWSGGTGNDATLGSGLVRLDSIFCMSIQSTLSHGIACTKYKSGKNFNSIV